MESQSYELGLEPEAVKGFYDAVIAKQRILDGTPPDQVHNGPSEVIVRELDAICPYAGYWVYMRGNAILPSYDEDGMYEGETTQKINGMEMGVHQGVVISEDIENPKRWVIMHQLSLRKDIVVYGKTAVNVTYYSAQFDMNSSVTLLQDVEKSVGMELEVLEDEDVIKNLLANSEKMGRIMQSERFRRLSQKTQKQWLEKAITQANRDTKILGRSISLLTEYGYTQRIEGAGPRFLPVKLDGTLIEGTCMGLFSLDEFALNYKPIRDDNDRIDTRGSICLAVDPENNLRDFLRLNEQQLIYIPSEQPMDLAFF